MPPGSSRSPSSGWPSAAWSTTGTSSLPPCAPRRFSRATRRRTSSSGSNPTGSGRSVRTRCAVGRSSRPCGCRAATGPTPACSRRCRRGSGWAGWPGSGRRSRRATGRRRSTTRHDGKGGSRSAPPATRGRSSSTGGPPAGSTSNSTAAGPTTRSPAAETGSTSPAAAGAPPSRWSRGSRSRSPRWPVVHSRRRCPARSWSCGSRSATSSPRARWWRCWRP